MLRNVLGVLMLGGVLVGFGSPAAASPCDYYRNQVDYCYIWLPAVGMDALAKIAIAGLSSSSQTVDVVLANRIGAIEVSAKTPYGYSYGIFTDGKGNLILRNGITCIGRHDTSVQLGRLVDYGYCRP